MTVVSCRPPTAADNHERLRLGLIDAGIALRDAVDNPSRYDSAHAELVRYCVDHVLPHLEHDERWLTRAEDCARAAALARAVREESRVITAVVHELESTESPCENVAVTRVLHTLLALHVNHEQRLIRVMGAEKER